MIVCCGEALIDMVEYHGAFVPYPGGAALNSAIALGRLGTDVGLVAGLSTDRFGRILAAELTRSNVATDLVVFSDRPTTLAFVNIENGDARYTFYDEGSAARLLVPRELPALPSDASALLFGGISLVLEPCGSTFEELARSHGRERVVMLDPNIRPAFIVDEDSHRERIDRMLSAATIVKVSREDLDWLTDGNENTFVQRCFDCGVAIVLVTSGGEGAAALTRKGMTVRAEPQPATVVDTIGAGDAFNAGFLDGLCRLDLLTRAALQSIGREDLLRCLRWAVTVASKTVGRAGANPPWRAELEPFPLPGDRLHET